jgi:hypothetical protein
MIDKKHRKSKNVSKNSKKVIQGMLKVNEKQTDIKHKLMQKFLQKIGVE